MIHNILSNHVTIWSFICKKESSNKLAHFCTLRSSLKDHTRCNGPFSGIMVHYRKHVGSFSLEDFGIWHETAKKKKKKSTSKIVLLTETFYINRKLRNFKKFMCMYSKTVDTTIFEAKVQVFICTNIHCITEEINNSTSTKLLSNLVDSIISKI